MAEKNVLSGTQIGTIPRVGFLQECKYWQFDHLVRTQLESIKLPLGLERTAASKKRRDWW